MMDLQDADPITSDLLLRLNEWDATTEHKKQALVSAWETLDAMEELEASLHARGQWQLTNNGLIQV